MKKAIAIITARGGSKRIPKKNIKEFCGKPIIAYSIEAALKSGCFNEVMVSTDSEEIAEIAKRYGASVPFYRSAATSDDYATTADVLMEVLERYSDMGEEFEYMACLYPTAPFVTADKLKKAMAMLNDSNVNAVMPVVAFSYPPQRCYVIDNNRLSMKWKENYSKRSQDLEKMYHDSGQFYMYRVKEYIKQSGRIMDNIAPIIVDELEVQDIDNETDWKLAEIKYSMYKEAKKCYLRMATEDDMQQVFDWANDKETRANSFNSKMIEWEEHIAWYNKTLSDSSSYIYILVDDGCDVGIVRLDYDGAKQSVTVSFSIDVQYRGKGYGRQIIELAYEKAGQISSTLKRITCVNAYVKKGNEKSRKCFEVNGFVSVQENEDCIVYEKSML